MLLLLLIGGLVLLAIYLYREWSEAPPGPWGLPVLGYLPWIDPESPHLTFERLARKYGHVFRIKLGTLEAVVLSDHRIIKEAFAKQEFSGRANLYLTHGIMKGMGVVVAEGERWREQRKFSLNCLKNLGMVRMGPKRSQMEERITQCARETTEMLREAGSCDPVKILLHTVGNLMMSLVFGKTWEPLDPTWVWLQHLQEDGVKKVGVAGPLNFLPFLRWAPKYRRLMAEIVDGQRKSHKIHREITEESDVESSIGKMFLNEMKAGKGKFFDEEQFSYLTSDLFGAGLDTTATTLRWFLLYIAIHQSVQDEVFEEIDSQLKGRPWPALDDMGSMPLTMAAIAETQRIRSVLPLGFPHANLVESRIEGYRIKKGTMIIPLQSRIHTDLRHWDDPEAYNPRRFIDPQGKFVKPEAFVPFQTGKRYCLGEELAYMILFLMASGITRNFQMSIDGGRIKAFSCSSARFSHSLPLLRQYQIRETSAPINIRMTSESAKSFSNMETPGYVGFANLPNQVHRKSVKKGFEFTLMVVGESGLGKSTLVNSLFLTDLYPTRKIPDAVEKTNKTVELDASTVEIEERGVKLRLTVVDTPGFGDAINNTDSFRAIIQYIDDQFERFLRDESGLNRRNIVDNRVHCCFYFISPFGHGLKPLDIEFMKQLHNKVNIVPVIAKADVLTKKEMLKLKKRIMEEIESNGIKIYPLPDCDSDEDEDYKEQVKQLKEAVPFAVCGATTLMEARGRKVRGRPYPWGVVEVENPEHCDFIKLRTMLITHMQDLQEVTQEVHYENYRSERLAKGAPVPKRTTSLPDGGGQNQNEKDKILQEKEAELRRMQEMLAKMQAQMQQQQQ